MSDFLVELHGYVEQGGFVMWPLVTLAFLLWYALGYRLMLFRREGHGRLRQVIAAIEHGSLSKPKSIRERVALLAIQLRSAHRGNIRSLLDHEFAQFHETIGTFSTLVRTVVVIAPLAGLLGTVSGMIEMFDSLADQTFFSQSGGVANGISQALITTQLGLTIAIPGLILGRLLDRQEQRVRDDIAQITEAFSDEGSTP